MFIGSSIADTQHNSDFTAQQMFVCWRKDVGGFCLSGKISNLLKFTKEGFWPELFACRVNKYEHNGIEG
jgi:hypothetical protein